MDAAEGRKPGGWIPSDAVGLEERESAEGVTAIPLDPSLLERLYDLLNSVDLGSQALDSALGRLQHRHGDAVYTELIYLLSHLRFDADEAKAHWERIQAHQQHMGARQGTPVDPRVALVSYFVEVNRKLRNPKIIEMKLFERTRESAYRDELTGLYNLRLFREYLAQEVHRSHRYGTPVSLVMVDVDYFKAYNDRNGHESGNEVLATVARLLSSAARKSDIAARYGGEEFALILPSTPKDTAHRVAERAREVIEDHCFPAEEALPGGRLTISAGIATFPADASDAAELVRNADRAMYTAKEEGRNRVRLYARSRRSYNRVTVRLDGSFRELSQASRPLSAVNLSEAGMLFLSDHPVKAGDLTQIELTLPECGRQLSVPARVVHADAVAGGFRVAVRFTHDDPETRGVLVAHLRSAAAREDSVESIEEP
jgi:diguanylate cyclase (GGDEF)-like protein